MELMEYVVCGPNVCQNLQEALYALFSPFLYFGSSSLALFYPKNKDRASYPADNPQLYGEQQVIRSWLSEAKTTRAV